MVCVCTSGLADRACAQEATIRKTIAERLPKFPKIDEVNKSAVPGLYELRMGSDIAYTDEKADFVIHGAIVDTKTQVNLTQSRVNKLATIEFAALPLKDAVVWKQGSGERKLVVFADPNCNFCRQFEGDLAKVKDVTVYTFLVPILGGDSPQKARNIWCAKESGVAWHNWMAQNIAAPLSMGACDDSAIARNMAMAKRYQVTVTPTLIFEDSKRFKGVLPPEDVDKQLALSRPRS
jgi:thiol:disulfide interchange protein DsbC